jgi:hypothetical protein
VNGKRPNLRDASVHRAEGHILEDGILGIQGDNFVGVVRVPGDHPGLSNVRVIGIRPATQRHEDRKDPYDMASHQQ